MMSKQMMSKQEMFNRAYRGLASQGWVRSIDSSGCVYKNERGHRCAWGWVDLSLDANDIGPVADLNAGIAADLGFNELVFATQLQNLHDSSEDWKLEADFVSFADRNNLTIPVLT